MLTDFDIFLLKKLTKNETKSILSQYEKEYNMQLMTGLENVLDSIYKASEGRIGCIDRILSDTGFYALSQGIRVLNNDLIHKNWSNWYHRSDEKDCSLCGFKP